jgi:plasmid rolling circle replication initiator protein Rep
LTVLAAESTVPNPNFLRNGANGALLSEISHRDQPWDVHRLQADEVARLYAMARGQAFERLGVRVAECSRWLEFALNPDRDSGEVVFRLQTARFCRVRYCPVCQWRRSLMWVARFMKRVMIPDFPKGRWLFLTLTVRNVPLDQLRGTLKEMNVAWKRVIQLKAWPGLGFIRSTELTRASNDYAHPHFHALLYVSPSYFTSRRYISHERWVSMWRKALRADYDPTVHIKVWKSKTITDQETGVERELAPVEGIKYAVKPCDLIGDGEPADADWLALLTKQTENLRFLATGGVLKDALREQDETNDDLIQPDGESTKEEAEELARWWFLWFHQRYRRRSSPHTGPAA